jgi:hypothetical protein
MVTGKKPFADIDDADPDARQKIRQAHEQGRLVADNNLPAVCRQVLIRATAADPKERYPSAEDFQRALQDALKPVPARRHYGKLVAACVLLLAIAAVAWKFVPRDSTEPIAELKADLDFTLTYRDGEEITDARLLGDPDIASLRAGDRGFIGARLSQGPRAHFYVVWIDSTGSAKPVYPPGWSWDQLPPASHDRPRSSLRWPETGDLCLEATPTGLESIVCLVRQTPWTQEQHDACKALLVTELKWNQPKGASAKKVVWIKNGEIASHRGGLQPEALRIADHPVRQLEAALLRLKTQHLAQYSFAVCYLFENR